METDRLMPPKMVALIVAAALTTGWLLASIIAPPVAEVQGLPPRTQQPEAVRDLPPDSAFTEQLNLKLRAAPAAPVTRRNPFVFGSTISTRASAPAAAPRAASPAIEPSPVPVVTGPSLRLSGIGSTTVESGVERTAVISDGRTVHLAKVGEAVAGYQVVAITDDSVTVQNRAGAQWTLSLK